MKSLYEPGDRVSLQVVRASRVLPDDVYWGIEHDGGFALRGVGMPVPEGAVPESDGRVRIVGSSVDPDRLVLVQDLRKDKR